MLNKSQIEDIEKHIGYIFRDKSLLIQAFTRASFCNEENVRAKDKYQSNEVLEFFGDSALSLAIVTDLIRTKTLRYSHGIKTALAEGDFSNIRSKLAEKKNLSENISRLDLEKYLIMGKGDKKKGVESEASVREDLLESLVGAVYIDSDFSMDAVIGVVSVLLDIDNFLSRAAVPTQSAKNMLQEWCQDKKRRMPLPVYDQISKNGPEHEPVYTFACYIDGKEYGRGEGKNQKLAESAAAEEALRKLGALEG